MSLAKLRASLPQNDGLRQSCGKPRSLAPQPATSPLQRHHLRRTTVRPVAVARPQLANNVSAFDPDSAKLIKPTADSAHRSFFADHFATLPLLSLGAFAGAGLFGSGFDVSGPGSILEAVGVLAAVVGIHEAGHFAAARLQNIHVTKFAIGFGPTLLRFTRKEVEYSLRAFPLGGFVAFPDDDPESPFPPDDPDLLSNRPVLDRFLVTSAGVVANVIFAYAICLTQAVTVGISEPIFQPGVKLGAIYPDTVASRAGLQSGDIVLSVGDLKVAPSPKSVEDVVNKIAGSPGKNLRVEVERAGERVELSVTPAETADGTGRIGISLGPNVTANRRHAEGPSEAVNLAGKEFGSLFSTVVRGLGQFVSNFKETASNVSGPVAILAVGSEVARTDATGLFRFAALININLAVVNVLPLPALDGKLRFQSWLAPPF
jgi:membrane-associated protease RseP (regulator of RpoE activity)